MLPSVWIGTRSFVSCSTRTATASPSRARYAPCVVTYSVFSSCFTALNSAFYLCTASWRGADSPVGEPACCRLHPWASSSLPVSAFARYRSTAPRLNVTLGRHRPNREQLSHFLAYAARGVILAEYSSCMRRASSVVCALSSPSKPTSLLRLGLFRRTAPRIVSRR